VVPLRLVGVALAVALLGVGLPVPAGGQAGPPGGCPTAYPLQEVRVGMVATGWTVERGDQPASFSVEVLGVVEHPFLQDRSVIVVDADRPGNDAIHRAGGIWYGMSGSPVYAPDGRLLGAVALGFTWGPSKLAGLTPAREMLDVLAYPRGGGPVASGAPDRVPLTGALAAEVRRREGLTAATDATLVPMPLPFPVRDQRTAQLVNDLARRQRLPLQAVTAAGTAATLPGAPNATPSPGGNFAAALSYGANSYYATGTTTFVCDELAMAFGHLFDAAGAVSMGASAGQALTVVADPLGGSYKLMNLAGLFGTLDQDRFAGVRADRTRVPVAAPVTTSLTDLDTGRKTSARTYVVHQRALPFVAAMHLWDAADTTLDRWGPGTSTLSWTVAGTRAGGREWSYTRENMFVSGWDIGAEFYELWELLDTLAGNGFEDVTFASVGIRGTYRQAVRSLRVGSVLVSVDGETFVPPAEVEPARPGGTLGLRVPLRGRDGVVTVELSLTVPEDAVEPLTVVVSGGQSAAPPEETEPGIIVTDGNGTSGQIDSLDDLLARLEERPRNDELVARIIGRGDGEPEPITMVADAEDGSLARARVDGVVTGEAFLELPLQRGETPGLQVRRVAGPDRIRTAVAVSQEAFPEPGMAAAVVIARADDYADALAGGPLAASVGGPVLLTSGRSLPGAVAEEVRRLGVNRALILGGTAAVSERVADDLREVGAVPQRIPGADRYDTARLIAARLGTDRVYLALGEHVDPGRAWADAVAVSGLAAVQRRPILLTEPDRLPAPTRQALGELAVRDVVIVGGVEAISRRVAAGLAGEQRAVERVGGRTRYETSLALARRTAEAGADPATTWLVTGRSYADGIVTAPAAAATGGVMVLLDGRGLERSPATVSWLEDLSGAPALIRVVGGETAITPAALQQVTDLLEGLP
jgi:putative cell wall-binding protein